MAYSYLTVDVFTDTRFEGAQIALVPEAQGLTDEQMQKIATEFNLWRTVFVLPADSANTERRLRIFNAKKEFQFGGHATVAAIYALAKKGQLALQDGKNHFKLSEHYGDVDCMVDMQNGEPSFNQFTTHVKPEYDKFTPSEDELGEMLSLKSYHFNVGGFQPLLVSTHLPYLFVPVDNFASLSAASFNYKAWAESTAPATLANAIFLFSMSNSNSGPHFHCRLVGPNFGHHEDPPIGAAIPAFAGYLQQFFAGQSLPYQFVAERGAFVGRKSVLNVELAEANADELTVKIGGEAVLVSEGQIYI
ncbi:PhzF family phenazine biosynthesis protein [Saccharobesus litoralis]|uniref:PhzF family phenazine biosynthesis protein n=1 Tax=Saccharobesus litoralis TaxID=2172099 RepID=A0A2S0VWA2_9ALTE|nr:PhzF family phenazine biosynthesis protein [Saccharobesus litoralis]AWB68453.1 PhzF family phenazine biosynthesis protein [Saccharobesus litoralis]